MKSAYETIQDVYDIDTLREIRDHGCVSGVAHDHIYYSDTEKFYDQHSEEIIDYIADTLGGEHNEELWNNNPLFVEGFKNDMVWTFIEIVAGELVEQYEDTTCEELSDSDEYYVASDGEVVFKCDEIDFDFSSKGDTLTAKPLNATTYEAVKELASTPWGKDHLEIVSA